MFDDATGAEIAVTDYMASLAQGIAAWMPEGYEVLGTDGFGLSESRPAARALGSRRCRHCESSAGQSVPAGVNRPRKNCTHSGGSLVKMRVIEVSKQGR